ncbi:hypothetical protein [Pseudomonas saxonica]|uniref:hypothetical protein n=1 Tax=Pseudomonas saxonica TaxID=2600598 RepID=UPI002D778B3A|nr:hypothetical protein [Pseudomonas saxonica]WRQ73092.1 hypothetical protein VQY67_12810 [Pseudomonas saxonica]
MRWMFLLLVVLNVFYYVWHQQEAPVKVKEVGSLSVSTNGKRTIQLLNEVPPMLPLSGAMKASDVDELCTYLAGINDGEQLRGLELKLESLNIKLVPATSANAELAEFHYRIAQENQVQASEELLQGLANEFKGLKYKKSRC